MSPQNSRRLLYEMIDREIANAQNGQPSGITLKLNNRWIKVWWTDCMPPPAPACRLIC
nr:Polyphosphate kinase [Klebsiella pneumoniae]